MAITSEPRASKPILEDVVNEIAPDVLALMRIYKSVTETNLKFYYGSATKCLIRNLERFVVPRVSSEAQRCADDLDIGDLSVYQWRDQNKGKMKGTRKSILHFEHVYPVGDMFNELAISDPLNLDAVRRILMKTNIAWVTKEENARLMQFNRPDPLSEYDRAGIHLLPVSSPDSKI